MKNMNKQPKNIIAKTVIALAILTAVPAAASAATVYLEPMRTTLSVGDTTVVTVKINSEGQVLNTVDGEITLKSPTGNLAVQEFSLANSAFGLWPRTPSLSADLHTVSFVGGVPGGFNIEGATVFKMIVEAKKEGTITIAPQNLSVFLSDGNGTKVAVKTKPITIKVGAKRAGAPAINDWSATVASDITPPEDFIIVFGQEKTLFSGKRFAFFSAVDNQSGIERYEVSENGAPAVRSGSTYVLQNQDEKVKLEVVAYDKAGNKKTASYSGVPGESRTVWPYVVVLVIVLAAAGGFAYRKMKRNKQNKNEDATTL
jgi:hypothetical protein